MMIYAWEKGLILIGGMVLYMVVKMMDYYCEKDHNEELKGR